MHYCGSCGESLLRRGAHCHSFGCGWQNPNYLAQEMEEVALLSGNPELAENIALASGDFETALEIEIVEDLGGW